ncbi:MAG: glycosyltransferase family 2 protein [Acidimicrobiia bacterium]
MIGWVFWLSVGLVGYVYAGYPLLVTLLAHLRPRPAWPRAPLPKVTLVIAAYNEEAVLEAKLEAVLQLDYPGELLQVIVAADGSDDSTVTIARRFIDRGVEVVHQPERSGKMAALDRAIAWATGDVIAFSDANNRFHTKAIRRLIAPYADESVGLTVGRKTVGGDSGLGYSEGAYWRYESHIRRMETRLGCTVGANGEIWAIRRDLYRSPPTGVINDDQWIAHAVIHAGFNVVFCPDAVSEEAVSETAADETERRSRMVAGQYQVFSDASIPWRRPLVAWMLVSHKLLRLMVPFGMIGAGLAAAAASVASPGGGLPGLGPPWGATALAAQAGFYGVALAGARLEGPLGRLAYVPRFLVDSNIAALRGLWRHLTGGQSAVWVRADRRPQ